MSAAKSVDILHTARVDADAVIVDFADDTSAIFTSEQLLSLAPARLKRNLNPHRIGAVSLANTYSKKPVEAKVVDIST